MNKLLISGVIGVVSLIAVWFWWSATDTAPPRLLDASSNQTFSADGALTNPAALKRFSDAQSNNAGDRYLVAIRRDPKYDWKRPISFFGKVVNQENKPVSDVQVRFGWNDLSAEGTSEKIVLSDSEGTFGVSNIFGKYLSIRFKKENHSPHPDNHPGFEFANPFQGPLHLPDPRQPVLFRLHRHNKDQSARLIISRQRYAVRKVGEKQAFPISHIPPETGLHVGRVLLQTIRLSDSESRAPWRTTVRMEDAVVQRATGDFAFEAPVTGYAEELIVESRDDSSWTDVTDMTFFFKTTPPVVYGKVRVRTSLTSGHLGMSYWINPSGSRNLDPGPEG